MSKPSLLSFSGIKNGAFSMPAWGNALVLFLILVCSIGANAQTLAVEATANNSEIFTGEGLLYTLKYSCSGNTNCTGVTLTAAIPSGIKLTFQIK